ncbi:MAG: putative biopolymer transporter protein [Candidatus Scalindua rubra]|uniref:Putative biopolymer transporter protein n=1 Tax=Candidatus Scalindua rubra TaxID=1872076 RepID=A0A1E3XCL8_9BACT|nr:MAG: putative biopolymer transporter protein [Candidatus Scalindua rubra]
MGWLIGGGPIMIPLFICSILALAVILERTINLRKNRIVRLELIDVINAIKGPEDIQIILTRCNAIKGPFSNIIKRAISNIHLSREEKVLDIQAAGRQEAKALERMLVVLEVITAIAPLLGLLGTVLGMSQVFDVISEIGLGQTKAFSGGIAQALRTTIIGLSIAIPCLVAYSSFDRKVDIMILEMEKYSLSLLNKLYAKRNK